MDDGAFRGRSGAGCQAIADSNSFTGNPWGGFIGHGICIEISAEPQDLRCG